MLDWPRLRLWKKTTIARYTQTLFKVWNEQYPDTPAVLFDDDDYDYEWFNSFKIKPTRHTIVVNAYFRDNKDGSTQLDIGVRTVLADYRITREQLALDLPSIHFHPSAAIPREPTVDELVSVVEKFVPEMFESIWYD